MSGDTKLRTHLRASTLTISRKTDTACARAFVFERALLCLLVRAHVQVHLCTRA